MTNTTKTMNKTCPFDLKMKIFKLTSYSNKQRIEISNTKWQKQQQNSTKQVGLFEVMGKSSNSPSSDPEYNEISSKEWQKQTKKSAGHAGLTYTTVCMKIQ